MDRFREEDDRQKDLIGRSFKILDDIENVSIIFLQKTLVTALLLNHITWNHGMDVPTSQAHRSSDPAGR
jgi:hypothetical protein